MPVTLTGVISAIASRAAPTVTAPASSDFPSDVSNNQPDQGLLDIAASLVAGAGLLALAGAWTALQTFKAGIRVFSNSVTTDDSTFASNLHARNNSASEVTAFLKNDGAAQALALKNGNGNTVYAEGGGSAVSGGTFSATVVAFNSNGGRCYQAVNGNVGFEYGGAGIPLILGSRVADPSSPPEGSIWVDRSANKLCVVAGGTIHRITLP